jgi:hypothetical protein
MLADEAYAFAALRMPRGNDNSGTARSPAGAVAIPPMVALHCEATRATRCRSIRAYRERWPERRRRRGVAGPAGSAWTGAGASAPGVTGRPPRMKLVAVGDAHEVVIPRNLKVQAPESDFESGWEGVRAAHRVSLAPVLGADYHRDG